MVSPTKELQHGPSPQHRILGLPLNSFASRGLLRLSNVCLFYLRLEHQNSYRKQVFLTDVGFCQKQLLYFLDNSAIVSL